MRYAIRFHHAEIIQMLLDKGVVSRAREEGPDNELLQHSDKYGGDSITRIFE